MSCVLLFGGGLLAAADDPFADLNLEAHGFASFGYLKTWGNNWHGETLDGTSEFWEAGANAIARPLDRLRIGAQVYARDLGIYGNGTAYLDWAYADYRVADALGIQAGRVKIPFGLFGEAQDIDSARTAVFLPRMYVTRPREALESTDGIKTYGSINDFDWALYAGHKEFATDGDFASYFAYLLNLSQVTDLDSGVLAGAMLHWHTPFPGLELRACTFCMTEVTASGVQNGTGNRIDFSAEDWWAFNGGFLYEWPRFTLAGEFLRYQSPRTITVTPAGGGAPIVRDSVYRDDFIYLTLTWHARSWLDLYTGAEGWWTDPANRWDGPYHYALIAAVDLHPRPNWSLKVEGRQCWGLKDIDPNLNPGELDQSWQLLALKTTVDF